MRLPRSVRALPLAAALALVAACGTTTTTTTTASAAAETAAAGTAVTTSAETHDDASDYEWDTADEIAVTLSGGSASSDSSAVMVDGSTVTITAAGTYRLSGTLTDGQVVVQTADDGVVRLVLDGVEVTSSTSAPLVVTEAGEVMVHLAAGTTNTLVDAADYYPDAADEPNAALFSAADLTITGEGALNVVGNANDGIASKDGLVISGGTITVEAVDDGIRGKDYLVLTGGTVAVTAGDDGLKSDNADDATMGYVLLDAGTVTVEAGGDGIDAETGVVVAGGMLRVDAADDALHSTGAIEIRDGDLTLASGDDAAHADATLTVSGGTTTVTSSYEGLESAVITISGGDIEITASDDGLNAGGGADGSGTTGQQSGTGRGGPGGGGDQFADDGSWIYLTGGELVVDAGGDGLDSNGSIEMTGGTVVVSGPTDNRDGALDANGTFTVTGGTLIAVGSSGMAQAPDAGGQAVLNVAFGSTQPAGAVVQVVDADGEVLAAFDAPKSFSSLVLSSADLVAGEKYSIYVGGTPAGEAVGYLSADGDLSGASDLGEVAAG